MILLLELLKVEKRSRISVFLLIYLKDSVIWKDTRVADVSPKISCYSAFQTVRVYSDWTRQRQIDGVSIVAYENYNAARPIWILRLPNMCSKTSASCFTPSNSRWRVQSEMNRPLGSRGFHDLLNQYLYFFSKHNEYCKTHA